MQAFDGFSYAVGDLMLGNNPADSTVKRVESTECVLKDIVETFGLQDILPWFVLLVFLKISKSQNKK